MCGGVRWTRFELIYFIIIIMYRRSRVQGIRDSSHGNNITCLYTLEGILWVLCTHVTYIYIIWCTTSVQLYKCIQLKRHQCCSKRLWVIRSCISCSYFRSDRERPKSAHNVSIMLMWRARDDSGRELARILQYIL